MILTSDKISREVANKNIIIDPFTQSSLNPNSYNYHLDNKLLVQDKGKFTECIISEHGYLLKPHTLYLANTLETLGSQKYAMSLIGRSSLGRLGLFLQVSANLGHTGSEHKWTLELVCTKKIKIYPYMTIGQISFWKNYGEVTPYLKGYSKYNKPKESRISLNDFNRK